MKKPTKAERDYMSKVSELGCAVCGAPAEVHHVTGAGMGLRSSHYNTIPLCPKHHRLGNHGEAIHAGVRTWEANYGTQEDFLEKTKFELGIECEVLG